MTLPLRHSISPNRCPSCGKDTILAKLGDGVQLFTCSDCYRLPKFEPWERIKHLAHATGKAIAKGARKLLKWITAPCWGNYE